MLATDIKMASLFAEPRKIIDADEAIEADRQRASRPRRGTPQQEAERHPASSGCKREITPEAAGDDPCARHSRHRLPPREQALLSGRLDRRAHPRPRQHRQPGHRRHREIHRRPGADRSARRRLGGGEDLEPVQLSVDLRVQHIVRDELASAMDRYQAIAARRGRAQRQDRRSAWRWPRCPTSTRTIRRRAQDGAPEPHDAPASTRWARPSRASPWPWRSIPAR